MGKKTKGQKRLALVPPEQLVGLGRRARRTIRKEADRIARAKKELARNRAQQTKYVKQLEAAARRRRCELEGIRPEKTEPSDGVDDMGPAVGEDLRDGDEREAQGRVQDQTATPAVGGGTGRSEEENGAGEADGARNKGWDDPPFLVNTAKLSPLPKLQHHFVISTTSKKQGPRINYTGSAEHMHIKAQTGFAILKRVVPQILDERLKGKITFPPKAIGSPLLSTAVLSHLASAYNIGFANKHISEFPQSFAADAFKALVASTGGRKGVDKGRRRGFIAGLFGNYKVFPHVPAALLSFQHRVGVSLPSSSRRRPLMGAPLADTEPKYRARLGRNSHTTHGSRSKRTKKSTEGKGKEGAALKKKRSSKHQKAMQESGGG
ncbi:hypothetical protein JCM11641_003162 [Rhodosporidiobolus odoratus]